jgi:dTDP-4-dehydrorhamnose reductase
MATPKVLIIGSRGFLGRYVARVAARDQTVFEGNRTGVAGPADIAIDIRDEDSVHRAFDLVHPDVVFLLAAHSDIDYCEQHPEEARAVNLRGADHVAIACAAHHAKLVFTSSGAVFDGHRRGYTEEMATSPVSVYGETKARAEVRILRLLPDAIVVRLALVIGFAAPPGSNAVLDKLERQLASGATVSFPVLERRNPIDPLTCSQFMVELVRLKQHGIFHIGSADSISRYDLGLKLASRMGYGNRVRPQLEPIPGRAPRGPDQFLLTDKLRNVCPIPIPTCDQVIERCFDGVAQGKV